MVSETLIINILLGLLQLDADIFTYYFFNVGKLFNDYSFAFGGVSSFGHLYNTRLFPDRREIAWLYDVFMYWFTNI